MAKDQSPYKILLIQDNAEDFQIMQKMLHKRISSPIIVHATDFEQAKHALAHSSFDITFLDLDLKGNKDRDLISEIGKVIDLCKVIILLDEKYRDYEQELLSLNISDYIIKGEMNSWLVYKSIVHAIEKNKILLTLKESRKRYTDLFQLSPMPMWIYNVETLKFRTVNNAAIRKYGYSKEEFEEMTLKDIRPAGDVQKLDEAIEFLRSHDKLFSSGLYRHQKKDGEIIYVELVSNIIYISHEKHVLVAANDITERVRYIQDIEEKNKKLQDIAFTQSHIVRAPLANMMGILHLAKDIDMKSPEGTQLLEHFITCGNQLDKSIREIVEKANQ